MAASTTNPAHKNTPERPARSRLIYLGAYLLAMLFIAFILAEVTARMITETRPNGVQKFHNVTLLPLRPNETQIRAALDAMHRSTAMVPDSDLGWSVRPNISEGLSQINAQGIRADPVRLYTESPSEGKVRIVTVGDSFVYCTQVRNSETWQSYLEGARGDLEILNLGLPGVGTDQAFLRWKRDGKPFNPHIVILGIWPDNVFRNLSIFDYYRTQDSLPVTKPRLVPDTAGGWRFVNSPILSDTELIATLTQPEGKALLKHEYWHDPDDAKLTPYRNVRVLQVVESVWRRFRIRELHRKLLSGVLPDGIDVTLAIVGLFFKDARDAGSIPLVLLIPDRSRMDEHVGEKPIPLVQALRDAGFAVIDMGPTFGGEVIKEGAAKFYVGGVGHHSPLGNQIFARHLERELRPWIKRAQGR